MPGTLKSHLPEIAAALRPKVAAAVKDGAQDIAVLARARVPVGEPTVHLKDDIEVERTGPSEYRVLAGHRAPGDTFYAAMVEFGTSHSAARPFLVPAAEAGMPAVVAHVELALRRL